MPTLNENIQRIASAKVAIKDAIVAKGVSVSDTDHIETFAEKIGQIQGGEAPKIDPALEFKKEIDLVNETLNGTYYGGSYYYGYANRIVMGKSNENILICSTDPWTKVPKMHYHNGSWVQSMNNNGGELYEDFMYAKEEMAIEDTGRPVQVEKYEDWDGDLQTNKYKFLHSYSMSYNSPDGQTFQVKPLMTPVIYVGGTDNFNPDNEQLISSINIAVTTEKTIRIGRNGNNSMYNLWEKPNMNIYYVPQGTNTVNTKEQIYVILSDKMFGHSIKRIFMPNPKILDCEFYSNDTFFGYDGEFFTPDDCFRVMDKPIKCTSSNIYSSNIKSADGTKLVLKAGSRIEGCPNITTLTELQYNVKDTQNYFPQYSASHMDGPSFSFNENLESIEKASFNDVNKDVPFNLADNPKLKEVGEVSGEIWYSVLNFSGSPMITRETLLKFFNHLARPEGKIKLHTDANARLLPEDISLVTGKGWSIVVE